MENLRVLYPPLFVITLPKGETLSNGTLGRLSILKFGLKKVHTEKGYSIFDTEMGANPIFATEKGHFKQWFLKMDQKTPFSTVCISKTIGARAFGTKPKR